MFYSIFCLKTTIGLHFITVHCIRLCKLNSIFFNFCGDLEFLQNRRGFIASSTDQCDQIWRKFANVSTFQKSLAIVWEITWYLAKCWIFFGSFYMLLSTFTLLKMGKYWKFNIAIWSHWHWSRTGKLRKMSKKAGKMGQTILKNSLRHSASFTYTYPRFSYLPTSYIVQLSSCYGRRMIPLGFKCLDCTKWHLITKWMQYSFVTCKYVLTYFVHLISCFAGLDSTKLVNL